MKTTTGAKKLRVELRFQPTDFPGVELDQIVNEIKDVYKQNAHLFSNFNSTYSSPNQDVFEKFVKQFIFLSRNTFAIPEDEERLQLLISEVLSGPILYDEYTKLINNEVEHPRFILALDDYAQLESDGEGNIKWEDIEAKKGKSNSKAVSLISAERMKENKAENVSLMEFIHCWDYLTQQTSQEASEEEKRRNEQKQKRDLNTGRKNKAFKHTPKYKSDDFPGVSIEDIAAELREAYANNKDILDNFREDYTRENNHLFLNFVEEIIFIKRNVANIVPSSQEQFSRLLTKLLMHRPIEYSEYCSILSELPMNKFGWGLDGFSKIDLDGNGSISPDEVEAAVSQNKRKKARFEALEKNNDGKISLAEFLHCWDHEAKDRTVPHKVLMVLTNHGQLGDTGRKSGYYLPEVAHPYHAFKEAGLDVVFVTPRGGYAPMDPSSYEVYWDDLICTNFIEDPQVIHALENTMNPANINPKDISVVFYVGGHGCMWDVAFNREIANIARRVYVDNNGLIGAVCHGVCGLLPITLKAASKPSILENRKVTSFTDEEEQIILGEEAWNIMNFSLEKRLIELEAKFHKTQPFECNVVNDKGIITGQNPQSSIKCAEVIIEEITAKIASKQKLNKLI